MDVMGEYYMQPVEYTELVTLLNPEEGFRGTFYFDEEGKITIGYGRNITDNPFTPEEKKYLGLPGRNFDIQPMTITEADYLRSNDITKAYNSLLSDWEEFKTFNTARQVVFIDLTYNMGINKVLAFYEMVDDADADNWDGASENLLNSRADKQEPNRIKHLAQILKTGIFEAYSP